METESVQRIIENIFIGFFLTTICILGILGNCITFLVLIYQQRKSRKVSINNFLIGLSICDTLFLFTWLNVGVSYAHRLVGCELNSSQNFATLAGAYFSMIIRPIGYVGQAGGTMFTVAITVDRFLAICYAMLAKRLWTQSRALYLTLIIFTVSVIFAIPIWFALQVEIAPDGVGYIVSNNELGQSKEFAGYNLWLYTAVNTIIPLPIVVVLNGFIFKKVREARKLQATMTKSQVSEISLAKMLLCVVLIFVVCNIPAIIRAIIFSDASNKEEQIRLSDAGRVEKYFPYTILRIVDWLCIAINSAVNFFIYCVMSGTFRKSLIYFVKSGISESQRIILRKKVLAPQRTMSRSRTISISLETTINSVCSSVR